MMPCALRRLEKSGVVSDLRCCESLVRRKKRARGREGLMMEMRARGVDAETAAAALESEMDEAEEARSALRQAAEMLRRGKDPADLANFIPIGCYEPAIMGKELSCTMQCVFNLSKPVEDLFANEATAPATWDDAESRYFASLERDLRDALATALVRWLVTHRT